MFTQGPGMPAPMQIVVPQGNMAQFMPGVFAGMGPQHIHVQQVLHPPHRGGGNGGGRHHGSNAGNSAGGQEAVAQGSRQGPEDGAGSRNRDAWRDLRRLNQHLSRLLGQGSPQRALPPAHMPGGELHAFLSVLQRTVAQLGVAIGDLQVATLEGGRAGPQPRHRMQFAMALVAASRTLLCK